MSRTLIFRYRSVPFLLGSNDIHQLTLPERLVSLAMSLQWTFHNNRLLARIDSDTVRALEAHIQLHTRPDTHQLSMPR